MTARPWGAPYHSSSIDTKKSIFFTFVGINIGPADDPASPHNAWWNVERRLGMISEV